MSSQALAQAAPEPLAGAAPDFYQTRDRMMRAYNPSTEEERLLVTQIAHAWLRLQRFYELESKMLAETDLFELFTKDVEKYIEVGSTPSAADRIMVRKCRKTLGVRHSDHLRTRSSPDCLSYLGRGHRPELRLGEEA